MIVSVGSGVPLRWLRLDALPDGRIGLLLWEVQANGSKVLGRETVAADRVSAVLQAWARVLDAS